MVARAFALVLVVTGALCAQAVSLDAFSPLHGVPNAITPEDSAGQVRLWHDALRANPRDANARQRLLQHYGARSVSPRILTGHEREARRALILDSVERDPAQFLLGSNLAYLALSGPAADSEGHRMLQALWQRQRAVRLGDVTILLNFARFLAVERPREAETELLTAQPSSRSDSRVSAFLGFLYARGVAKVDTMDRGSVAERSADERRLWANHCRAALEVSQDAMLLQAASAFLMKNEVRPPVEEELTLALRLQERAGQLSPARGKARPQVGAVGPRLLEEQRIARGGSLDTRVVVSGPSLTSVPAPSRKASLWPRLIRVGGSVMMARLDHTTVPEYPAAALQARIEGVVLLNILVARDGTVKDASVLSGHPSLHNAAVRSVRQWRWKPFLLGDGLAEVLTQIEIPFKLPQPIER